MNIQTRLAAIQKLELAQRAVAAALPADAAATILVLIEDAAYIMTRADDAGDSDEPIDPSLVGAFTWDLGN